MGLKNMKKLLIILSVLILTGCTNVISVDFNENINTNIKLSFSLEDYKNNHNDSKMISNDEARDSISALRSDIKAFTKTYDGIFTEKEFVVNQDNYSIQYEYTYDYDNFVDNSIFKRCFQYSTIDTKDDTLYVSLKGESICAPFKLEISSNNRMLTNNSNERIKNKYVWNIEKENNDIFFSISKNPIINKNFDILSFIGIGFALLIILIAAIIKKKYNEV